MSWSPRKLLLPLRAVPKGTTVTIGLFSLFSTPIGKQEEILEEMVKRGILEYQKGDAIKAEKLLHVALKTAQDLHDKNGITFIYDLMANIAFDTHNYRKAEKIFRDLIGRLIGDGVDPDHNKIVHVSAKLASIYGMLEENEKAEQGFQFCIDTMNKKIAKGASDEDTLLLTGLCLDWYARYLMGHMKLDEASANFQKAFELCSKVHGLQHDQSLVLLNDMASVLALKGNAAAAEEKMKDVISIGEKIQSEHMPAFYVNLGSIYMQNKSYEKSRDACAKGVNLAKKMDNKEYIEEAETCLEELRKAMRLTH
nr:EOG090X06TI [Artemia franciscana]